MSTAPDDALDEAGRALSEILSRVQLTEDERKYVRDAEAELKGIVLDRFGSYPGNENLRGMVIAWAIAALLGPWDAIHRWVDQPELNEPEATSRQAQLKYDIRRNGHAITGGAETLLTVPKVEMTDGKLFNSEEARVHVLALLLESVGIDAAIKLGSPQLWREALTSLSK